MSRSRPKLTLDERAEIKMAFVAFDKDEDKQLSYREFKAALFSMGFYPKKIEVQKAMGGLQFATYEQFKAIASAYISNRDPKKELHRIFHLFDEDHDGFISARDLQSCLYKARIKTSDEKILTMIKDFDQDKDKKISIDEFIAIMDPMNSLT